MTALRSGAVLARPLRDQLDGWAARLRACVADGAPPLVAFSPDRVTTARAIATACGTDSVPLGDLHPETAGAFVIVVSSTGAATRPAGTPVPEGSVLHALLRREATIWGITGPRPNPVAVYCQDTVAIADGDPSAVAQGHRRIAAYLGASITSGGRQSSGAEGGWQRAM